MNANQIRKGTSSGKKIQCVCWGTRGDPAFLKLCASHTFSNTFLVCERECVRVHRGFSGGLCVTRYITLHPTHTPEFTHVCLSYIGYDPHATYSNSYSTPTLTQTYWDCWLKKIVNCEDIPINVLFTSITKPLHTRCNKGIIIRSLYHLYYFRTVESFHLWALALIKSFFKWKVSLNNHYVHTVFLHYVSHCSYPIPKLTLS